jgi:hypothetical protein
MLPAAHIKHRIPGRARVKIESRRGNVAYFRKVEQQLATCSGINCLETNPVTGSLLVLHTVELESIGSFAEEKGLFRLATLYPPTTVPVTYWISDNLKELDRGLKVLSGEAIDLTGLLFLALVGLAIYQGLQGDMMAPAVTLIWYALATLQILDIRE